MFQRIRRFLDVRSGEGLPVLLTFLYIWAVVASFLLAKPIRTGLFLGEHNPYDLVYVYAAVPLVLSLFVPGYTRVAARLGARTVTVPGRFARLGGRPVRGPLTVPGGHAVILLRR